ncbi:class II glutamine amidotransferase [Microbacterium sp. 179-B 1A2 NHS]|uniref:class II glutamine amidotransferase n=1 Tax=Microbacterium sp. 179-B 1A2 NHS TaxID=3142383 RepID=UPI0039A1652D
MCRWLAYLGEPLRASTIVLDAEHSIVAQSLNSPLGAETVNGDGFGLGWYSGDPDAEPTLFHSIEPAWHDENLRELTRSVESPLFFAHVRAAGGPPIQRTNCHPFRFGRWMFMHNGLIGGWPSTRRDLMLEIDPELFPRVLGTTDSEALFHLALSYGLEDDPIAAVGRAIRFVEAAGRGRGVGAAWQGTIAVADGERIWAFRYSTSGRSRTLFHAADVPTLREMYPDAARLSLYGDDARLMVSEPISDLPGAFHEVPEATVVIIDHDGYQQHPFLAD